MKLKPFFSSVKVFMIKYWYVLPVLLAVLSVVLFTRITAPTAVIDAWWIIVLLILVLLPITWVILLVNKKWLEFTISFLGTIVIVGGVGVFSLYTAAHVLFDPDTSPFGKEHPIPANLEYNLPLTDYIVDPDSGYQVYVEGRADSLAVADIHDATTYLSVRNGFQGGMYRYDFSYGPLPAGEIYLKCFEVTENIPLSEKRIRKASRVEISQTKSFSKLVDKQEFTIYEGVWDDYYAARVEVWFKDAKTKEEKKLVEKVYRVEGWQR